MNLNLLKKRNLLQQSPMSVGNPQDDEEDEDDPEDASALEEEEEPEEDTSDEDPIPEPTSTKLGPTNNTFQRVFGQAINQPVGLMTGKFTDYLNQPPPERKDFQPGKLDRLAAILGGASEGYQRGAGAGIKTARQVLDRPYSEAMNKYAISGKNLESGAELESKNLGRAASFARTAGNLDIAEGKNQVANKNADIAKIKAEAQDRHWQAADAKAAIDGATKGYTHYTNADGHLIFTRPKGDGTLETLDGGKIGESIPEKTRRILSEHSQKEAITGARQKSVADNAALNTQIEGNRRAGYELIKKDKQTEEDKEKIDARAKAKSNEPDTTKTEVKDAEGKVKSTRTVTKSKSGSGTTILKDKNGKEWEVDAKDVEAFKKANGIK